MANGNETVESVLNMLVRHKGFPRVADRILAAHKRECEQLNTEIEAMSRFNDALNAQMKELAAECERLRAALKPVLELENKFGWEMSFRANSADAVRESQRIYKEVK